MTDRRTDLRGRNFVGADLSDAAFEGADLSGSNLSNANLSAATLTNANLSGANLVSVDLRDADLSGANLTNANLAGGTLAGADLTDANFAGANVTGVSFAGANVGDATFASESASAGDADTDLTSIVVTVVTGVTLVLAFSLMAIGWPMFWIVFIIGFAFVLPAAMMLAPWYDGSTEDRGSSGETDAEARPQETLESLRERYAAGELSDEEFERRVEDLLLESEDGEASDTSEQAAGPTSSETTDAETDEGVESQREGDTA